MSLLSPFTTLLQSSEDRLRLGIKNQASLFFLLSPFTIFVLSKMSGMELMTRVEIKGLNFGISHSDTLLFMGSCFSQEIGNRFLEACFDAVVNPFGVVYNPLSLHTGLVRLLHRREYVPSDIFRCGALYHSFEHHSSFSGTDAATVLLNINNSLLSASDKLYRASCLFITFGTAWVYERKATGQVVSNCHKLPASEFTRRRVSATEAYDMWRPLLEELFAKLPDIKVVLTVSPVRHLRDGAHENNLSKSELLLLCDKLQRQFPEKVCYFPSYEILLDELRDYRFYAEDMAHPSQQAVEYIWGRLSDTFFNTETRRFITEWKRLLRGLEHRPLTPDRKGYVKFLDNLAASYNELAVKYPFLDISPQLAKIEAKKQESQ